MAVACRPLLSSALLLALTAPALANQPDVLALGYTEYASARYWLPHGLLDRMRLAPFHMSATTEVSTLDGADTASLVLHAQMSTNCGCNIGAYATLPTSISLADDTRAIPAGATVQPRDVPRTQLGTMDIGFFGGTRSERGWVYRVGALLPTAPRDPAHAALPSARAGDRVLELPRSAGARLSTSWIFGADEMPRLCLGRFAVRVDAGIDVASVVALPGNPVHIIPHLGAGMQLTRGGDFTYSLDTVISADPFVDDNANTRWSTGITARHARADGRRSRVQGAVTLAATRLPDGWGASVLVDLTASALP